MRRRERRSGSIIRFVASYSTLHGYICEKHGDKLARNNTLLREESLSVCIICIICS